MFGQQPQGSAPNFFDTSNLHGLNAQGNMAIQYNVEIVALHLQETGTYNDHYVRSYKAQMSHDDLNGIVSAVAQSNMNTRGTLFGSLASNVLDLNAKVRPQDMIQVPNGWGTKRFRFLLQVRETSLKFPDSVYFTYVQGFSESADISMQTSQINPEMRFFINNFVRIQEYTASTPNGPRKMQRVEKSGQVVNGVLVADPGGVAPTHYMRPADVLGKIQTDNDSELRSGDIFDTRNTNIAGSNSVLNNFGNNTATQYLSRLVTPMVDSIKSVGFGPGHGNFVDTATANSLGAEPSYNDSPFLTLLVRRFNMVGAATFSMNELAQIDPTVGQRTRLRPVAQNWQQGLATRGGSEFWNTSTPETLLATKLVNAIPGFMWASYIGSISFGMSNALSTGQVELKIQNLVPVTNFAPPEYVAAFLTNMQEMVARDISYNGQQVFEVFVNASILGDVHLSVSVNGSSPVNYTAPAFGSGVLNPIYTHDQNNFNNLAIGMRTVMDGLQSVYKESSDFSGAGSLNPNI